MFIFFSREIQTVNDLSKVSMGEKVLFTFQLNQPIQAHRSRLHGTHTLQ